MTEHKQSEETKTSAEEVPFEQRPMLTLGALLGAALKQKKMDEKPVRVRLSRHPAYNQN